MRKLGPEMNAGSHSSSQLLSAVLFGVARTGTPLSRHDLLFGDYVVSLTPPHMPRVPNGIECRIAVSSHTHVTIGRGRLIVGRTEIDPGEEWNPVPVFPSFDCLPAGPEPRVGGLAGWIGALPEDALGSLIAGYIAGLVLLHAQHRRAERIALRALQGAGPMRATLLRHAALGEVPEPVHDLLITRDPARLIAFSPDGMLWLRGLLSAGLPLEPVSGLAAPALQTLG